MKEVNKHTTIRHAITSSNFLYLNQKAQNGEIAKFIKKNKKNVTYFKADFKREINK